MRSAADMHIHGFSTRAINIAHRTRQRFGALAFQLLLLPVLRLLLLCAGPMLFLCETPAQLNFSALHFNLVLLRLSKKAPCVSGLELSLSWGFDSVASSDGLGFFAAMVGVDCNPIGGASAGNRVHLTRGIVGRRLQGKESVVGTYLTWGQERLESMARAVVLWEWRRTTGLGKELACLTVHEGPAIADSKVAGRNPASRFSRQKM